MTLDQDTQRLLDAWFSEGPVLVADRVVDGAANRISRTRQRPAWRLQPWRLPEMSAPLKAALVGVALLAVLFASSFIVSGGRYFATGPAPTIAPSPTPTPSPTQTPAASVAYACENGTTSCEGLLQAGSHSTHAFVPGFTYTMPDTGNNPLGPWANSLDVRLAYTLRPPGQTFSFGVLSDVVIPQQTPDCTPKAKAGTGSSVDDWVTFLTTHPGLDTDTPAKITIGGHAGYKVHIQRSTSWTATCPNSIGPAIEQVMHTDPSLGVQFIDDQQETFYIVDVSGETVIIHVDSAPSLAVHRDDLATAQPLIDSIAFQNP